MTQSTGRIQKLFKQYGRTAVGVHLAVYTASFAGRPMHEAGRLQHCRAVQQHNFCSRLLQACMLPLKGAWTLTNCSPSMACCQVNTSPQRRAACRLTWL